jgi:microcystin-dependent protein
MSEAFIGQICMFGGNFAPRNFAFCNGQVLPIAQNQALFALIGTTYGGDGRTTFALPNLQSRLPVHQGQGPGLSNYNLGQSGGSQAVTIDISTMPSHTHTLEATQEIATTPTIGSSVLTGQPTVGNPPGFYAVQQTGQPSLTFHQLAPASCGSAGGGQPHTNLMPSLCITFIICLQGIFPSRN